MQRIVHFEGRLKHTPPVCPKLPCTTIDIVAGFKLTSTNVIAGLTSTAADVEARLALIYCRSQHLARASHPRQPTAWQPRLDAGLTFRAAKAPRMPDWKGLCPVQRALNPRPDIVQTPPCVLVPLG